MNTTEPEILFSVERGLGRITLNRPTALNALNHAMFRAIDATLISWADDDRVRAVVVDGAGERGFSAGGDVRAVYEGIQAGGAPALALWADEYRMIERIIRFGKPYVALMDGLVMGGGLGVAAHGSLRVVTERSRVGMPEVRIGFVPDVGATYLLARTPGQAGMHMALTGAPVTGADAIYCGLADYIVPSGRLPDLLEALADEPRPEAAVERYAEAPPPSELAQVSWIDPCYEADTAEEIVARLLDRGGEAAAAAAEILQRSPTSVKVALRAVRSAAVMTSPEAAIDQEFRIASHLLRSHDLKEGIRAQIIDKDRNPHWQPPTLAEVTDEAVDAYFEPLGDGELGLERNLSA